jgi:hypothetical protein
MDRKSNLKRLLEGCEWSNCVKLPYLKFNERMIRGPEAAGV